MAWRDGADERLAAAIAAELDHPAMVTRFVVIADATDEDGDRVLAMNAGVDQRAADTLGLLAFADTVERARVGREWLDADDDD